MIETQFCNFSKVQGKITVRFQRGMVEKIPKLNVRLQTAIFDVKVTHTSTRTSSGWFCSGITMSSYFLPLRVREDSSFFVFFFARPQEVTNQEKTAQVIHFFRINVFLSRATFCSVL